MLHGRVLPEKSGPFCISFLFFVYGVFRNVQSIVKLFIQLCNPIWCCNSHKKLGSRVSQGVHPLSLPSPPTSVYDVGIYFLYWHNYYLLTFWHPSWLWEVLSITCQTLFKQNSAALKYLYIFNWSFVYPMALPIRQILRKTDSFLLRSTKDLQMWIPVNTSSSYFPQ